MDNPNPSPQENKPIGTTILQLSVIDHDSSHNGPPFDFHIMSGNEGGEFLLEKDGTLVANRVFRRDLAAEYVIEIQVLSTYCRPAAHFNHPTTLNNTVSCFSPSGPYSLFCCLVWYTFIMCAEIRYIIIAASHGYSQHADLLIHWCINNF